MVFGNRKTPGTWTLRCAVAQLSAVAALAALAGTGCAGAELSPLTPHEIAEHGTLEIAAPRTTVFEACVQALRNEGYSIDAAEPVTGLVVTLPMRIQTDTDAEAGEARFRAYVVQVRETAGGKARVVATPAPAEPGGAANLQRPTTAAWDLDRERAAWSRLFADVRALLATTPAQPR